MVKQQCLFGTLLSIKVPDRHISLTKLIPEMLQKLDDEIISFCPAVEIAALSEKEQKELLVAMEYVQAIPSFSQAQRMERISSLSLMQSTI